LYEKEPDEKGLDKKGLKSKLANLFIIKSSNPGQNGKSREPQTTFDRDPQAGFFQPGLENSADRHPGKHWCPSKACAKTIFVMDEK
jgi:hypothetical protein